AAIPAAWPKDLTERAEKLTAEIQKAQTTLVVAELEKAVRAGKYAAAVELLKKFDEKQADANAARQYSTLKAQIEIVEPRYQKARKLLRAALDRLVAGTPVPERGALGGGFAIAVNVPVLAPQQVELWKAGDQVHAELHPDTT